jgi:hypothetical protein
MQKHSLIICRMAAVAAILATPLAIAQEKKAAAKTKPAAEAATDKKPATDAAAAKQTDAAVAGYDAILKKYVKDGKFAYAALLANKADMATFKKFMEWQGKADVKSMSREGQIAFYINAYNSCCIQAILDHYPVHSPNDVPGFFDKLKFKVGGEELTISGIEYERLIANYKDMRAHFAVVCADRGCQPLKASAWTGAVLNDDLEAAAKFFVSDKKYFFVDYEKKEVNISKIFEWYAAKFTADPNRPAAKPELFLLPWVSEKDKAVLESGDYKIKIIEWDWTLNETAPKKSSK